MKYLEALTLGIRTIPGRNQGTPEGDYLPWTERRFYIQAVCTVNERAYFWEL